MNFWSNEQEDGLELQACPAPLPMMQAFQPVTVMAQKVRWNWHPAETFPCSGSFKPTACACVCVCTGQMPLTVQSESTSLSLPEGGANSPSPPLPVFSGTFIALLTSLLGGGWSRPGETVSLVASVFSEGWWVGLGSLLEGEKDEGV